MLDGEGDDCGGPMDDDVCVEGIGEICGDELAIVIRSLSSAFSRSLPVLETKN